MIVQYNFTIFVAAILLMLCCPHAVDAIEPDQAVQDEQYAFFEAKIRPVLVNTCFQCHGGEQTNNGLRVDSREALLEGGIYGPAIVPNEPDASLMIEAIRHNETAYVTMPPDEKLPDHVVRDFEAWVKTGAIWPPETAWQTNDMVKADEHWAFLPVKAVEPPTDISNWSNHPIDRFISAQRVERGLNPNPPAEKGTLMRRVYFDLVGLPPTPEEVYAFLADTSPHALERLVERLLASPRYGERWGRHWMDVVRYADTAGDNADYPIPEAHLYRDYIIDSFNADKPYDRFVQEQLAGDILANNAPPQQYAENIIATGFIALSRRFGTGPLQLKHLIIEDTIDTTGRAFLGLTMRCARCHDHKFEPITMQDYYAMYGIFDSTTYPYPGSESFQTDRNPRTNFVPLQPPEQVQPQIDAYQTELNQRRKEIEQLEHEGELAEKRNSIKQQIESLREQIKTLKSDGGDTKDLESQLPALSTQQNELRDKINHQKGDLKRKLPRSDLPADMPQAYAVKDGEAKDTLIHRRGDPAQSGPVIRRDVPKFLNNGKTLEIPEGQSGRLQLAQWLTNPANPLTARVMVNRIWQYHFGKGIVSTPSNFGRNGAKPTHPLLIDYLATRFIESGWSVKAMHRLILSSKTYQLASSGNVQNAVVDPSNEYYWRFNRRRLDAEALRDAVMNISGILDLSRPGAHPFPPIEKWFWSQHVPFPYDNVTGRFVPTPYPSNHRTVYLMTQRLQYHPFLGLFDGPDTNTTTGLRTISTIPQQSLYLMNNPWTYAQAQEFGKRLIAFSQDPVERINRAHLLAYGREATTEEKQLAEAYIKRVVENLQTNEFPPEKWEMEAWNSYAQVLLRSNELLYID